LLTNQRLGLLILAADNQKASGRNSTLLASREISERFFFSHLCSREILNVFSQRLSCCFSLLNTIFQIQVTSTQAERFQVVFLRISLISVFC